MSLLCRHMILFIFHIQGCREGGKLVLYYMTTTAAAVLIGLSLALWLKPGKNLSLPDVAVDPPVTPDFSELLLRFVPKKLIRSLHYWRFNSNFIHRRYYRDGHVFYEILKRCNNNRSW